MRRRDFITRGGGAAAAAFAARAQQSERIWRIGVLNVVDDASTRTELFRQGLRDLGYIEGRNFLLERRFSVAQYDQLDTSNDDEMRFRLLRAIESEL